MGLSRNPTPDLAKLAADGVRFSNAFACMPVCSPSQLTYLTGKLPSSHDVQNHLSMVGLAGPKRQRFLEGHLTYSKILARNGYTVGASGKSHMGDDENPHGATQGRKFSIFRSAKDPVFF